MFKSVTGKKMIVYYVGKAKDMKIYRPVPKEKAYLGATK